LESLSAPASDEHPSLSWLRAGVRHEFFGHYRPNGRWERILIAVRNQPRNPKQLLLELYDGRYSRTRERAKIRLALHKMTQAGLLVCVEGTPITFTASALGEDALRKAGL
jgi:hypothetical protein